ncbi:MAG: bifunctional (p)ppGpp synthetase/guanosine-3',5'-bis(diphosphate) 3'-pyrophosphohydrolase [Desulfovibrio sp.]|jgi:GTP pyrophosphokinase|nr:bifunctional (p)ppGpp synthetase/guanosine-3',5'-bis(diphosphate) 3'-pyrophosphohydrolase [Desulfovibrio sp.]
MIRIQDVLDKVERYQKPEDVELVRKAYVYAAAAHAGQVRLSGEPYLSHPLAVADTLADMRLDGATVAAGLLHDTVEDTKATIEEIDESFGEDVADIVDGVTKISLLAFDSKEAQQAENIRKMLLAMNEDMRVLFVKLADRLHNMRTLEFMKPEKQRRIARETMDIYAPLSNRLGLHRIKLALEDLSFRYTSPDAYDHVAEWIERHKADDAEYIDTVISSLQETLDKNGINSRVKGRIKHIYSIYRKMTSLNISLDEMHDIIAFRAIVDDLKDCYAALGLVHATWKPVPGRFKDYISMPKRNMYQSLHTTVIGPKGERMEVQIRTEEMDRLAEHGLASHWLYKEGGRVRAKDVRQFTWLREMLDWTKMESDSREFLRSLRFDLFKDEIYVFTPRGAVKELPENATPVDFAYQIHTEVGDRCAGSKINGKLMPLSSILKSGDTVEIITAPNRRPSRDWLKFVKTAKARTRVQYFIRTEERERSISLGREMLEKQGRRAGVNIQKHVKDGSLLLVAQELKFAGVEELMSAVGYARITPRKILGFLLPKPAEEAAPVPEAEQTPASRTPASKPATADSVVVKGVDDILIRFANCCNPVPGDPIIGYTSRGRGVTVHTADCPTINQMEPERLLPVHWEGSQEDIPFPARIHILCRNTRGMLARIAATLDAGGVNIDSGSIRSHVDGRTEMELLIEVSNLVQLIFVQDKLRKIDKVLEVSRMVVPGVSEAAGRFHAGR